MHPDAATELLDIYLENSRRILSAGFGVNAAESTFFDVIDLLRQHPEIKPRALDQIAITFNSADSGLLDGDMVPSELVELIAHELRWEDLRQLAELRIATRFRGDRAMAVSDLAVHVLAAFSESWEDRMFYRRYAT